MTLNNVKYHAFYARGLQASTLPFYFLDKPDVEWAYDGESFKDGKIFTINNFIFNTYPKIKKKDKVKYFAFGFPSCDQGNFLSTANYDDFVNPSLYDGTIADSTHYNPIYKSRNIDSMYYTTVPKAWGGTSGSPVFIQVYRNKRKGWVEFAGIQSGKNDYYNCAYIVKKIALLTILKIKSN